MCTKRLSSVLFSDKRNNTLQLKKKISRSIYIICLPCIDKGSANVQWWLVFFHNNVNLIHFSCFSFFCHVSRMTGQSKTCIFFLNVKTNYLSIHVCLFLLLLFLVQICLFILTGFFSNHSKSFFHWLDAHLLALAHIYTGMAQFVWWKIGLNIICRTECVVRNNSLHRCLPFS